MNPSLFPTPFLPDYGGTPGDTLRDVLERLGLTQSDLAERTGRPKKTINEIVQGKAAITPETALQLERVLGIPASFWNNLERSYRAALARLSEASTLVDGLPWLETLPIREMVKRGWIQSRKDRVDQLREALTFFGVAFPNAWEDVWSQTRRAAVLRQGQTKQADFGTVATWLRRGEIEGRALACEKYDEQRFRGSLGYLRGLTNQPAKTFCREIQARCASAGVAVAFVRELPRLRIFGAARWLSAEKALIQLSLYYKREDQLWFSFFHEAGHILLHGRRDIFVDLDAGASDKQEEEANRFASDLLIPPRSYESFIENRRFSVERVMQFARQNDISPGIVVGRLQHDGHIDFNQLTQLRRRIDWSLL